MENDFYAWYKSLDQHCEESYDYHVKEILKKGFYAAWLLKDKELKNLQKIFKESERK